MNGPLRSATTEAATTIAAVIAILKASSSSGTTDDMATGSSTPKRSIVAAEPIRMKRSLGTGGWPLWTHVNHDKSMAWGIARRMRRVGYSRLAFGCGERGRARNPHAETVVSDWGVRYRQLPG